MTFPSARPEKVDRNESGSISRFSPSLSSLYLSLWFCCQWWKEGRKEGKEEAQSQRSRWGRGRGVTDFAKSPFYFMNFQKKLRFEMDFAISGYESRSDFSLASKREMDERTNRPHFFF